MPLDPRVKRFLDVLAAAKLPNALENTVEQRRLGLAELMKLACPDAPACRIEEQTVPGPAGTVLARQSLQPEGQGQLGQPPGAGQHGDRRRFLRDRRADQQMVDHCTAMIDPEQLAPARVHRAHLDRDAAPLRSDHTPAA